MNQSNETLDKSKPSLFAIVVLVVALIGLAAAVLPPWVLESVEIAKETADEQLPNTLHGLPFFFRSGR